MSFGFDVESVFGGGGIGRRPRCARAGGPA